MNQVAETARSYDMTQRSAAAARTRASIIRATETLLTSGTVGSVTLAAISEESGVTVQTVLRHMESREGCLNAVADAVKARVEAQRGHVPPGDVEQALTTLLDHYEAEGRLILNLLTQENAADPLAQRAATQGRAYHRNWIQHCFGPLCDLTDPVRLDALVAATDLYLWKLLRLDLGRSPEHVRSVLTELIRPQLESS